MSNRRPDPVETLVATQQIGHALFELRRALGLVEGAEVTRALRASDVRDQLAAMSGSDPALLERLANEGAIVIEVSAITPTGERIRLLGD